MCFVRTELRRTVLAAADAAGDVHLYVPRADDDPTADGGFTREDGTLVTVGNRGGNPVHDMVYLPRRAGWPRLVTVGGGGTTHIYDLSTGKESVRVLPHERLRVVDVLQEPDGSATIAVAGMSDTVHLWRGDSETPVELGGHTGPVRALKVLRGERRLAVAHQGGITVWDLSEQPPTAAAPFGRGDIRSLAVIRDSLGRQRLASACPHGIKLWDPDTGDELAHFARSLSVSKVMAFEAKDGDPLLAAASDNMITLWSPATEEQSLVRLAVVHHGTIKVLARIPASEGNLLAAADDAGLVAVWCLPSQRSGPDIYGSHDDWVNELAYVPAHGGRSALLASASDDRTVRLWKVGVRQPPEKLPHNSQVQALAVVGDGLATGDEDGVVRVWSSAQDGSEPWCERTLCAPKTPCSPIRAMVSFAQGTRLVTAGGSGHCLLWDAADGKILRYLRAPAIGLSSDTEVVVRALAAAKVAGRWLIAAGDSVGRIELWDAENEANHWTWAAHPAQVRSLAVLSTGRQVQLASGGDDGAIRLWAPSETGSALEVEKVDAHTGPVAALYPVTAGKLQLLASGGADRSIRLWDPATLEPVSVVFNAHSSWVRALCQVPADGATWLASGGEDGTIRLLQVKDGQLLRRMHDVSIHGFRDRLAKTDLLNRRAIVTELRELLSPDVTEVPSGTSGPQVVMIQGPWGTGKSSLMHDLLKALDDAHETPPQDQSFYTEGFIGDLLQQWRKWRLRELSPFQAQRLMRATRVPGPVQPPPTRHTVTAWFNPWAHESSEQVWSGLAWSIIDATRDTLGASVSERQSYWLSRNVQRLDRAALRRTINQRIWRPTLAALAVLLVPVTLALINGRANLLTQLPESASAWVLALVGVSFVLFALFATWQFFFGRVTNYLPVDILDGPVLPTSSISVAGEKLQRDLPYLTTTGSLYRAKEDVHNLVRDLANRGYQVVVFIDDLDRCTDRSVTEVFEAVNSFIFNQYYPESAPRFVIGLDPSVVARRLRDMCSIPGQGATYQDPDDPDAGWNLLRKLCQLTVVLPGIRSAHTVRLLRQHTPARPDASQSMLEMRKGLHTIAGSENVQPPVVPNNQLHDKPGNDVSYSPPVGGVPQQTTDSPLLVALEGDPTVQEHLRQLVMLRPRQTMRETKRLLTLWGFYVGLLRIVMPVSATANALGACHALTLAEIIRRWPALVPALTRTGDGPSGLNVLIKAAHDQDDSQSSNWSEALARLGLSQPEYASATANLHELLLKYGNETVADFADCLL